MITETELIEKYAAAPEKLSEMIQKRKAEGLLSAFGYASNLDLLCSFQPEALSRFLTEELNGSDYIAVPFIADEQMAGSRMKIGYIVKKNMILSKMAELYIRELRRYLQEHAADKR